MANVIKYAVYIDQLNRVFANNTKFNPLDTLHDSFYDERGVSVVDLTTRGFNSVTLKDSSMYPHSLICLSIDETNNIAGPGLVNTPIEDAVVMGLGGFGGRELEPSNALLLTKSISPAKTWDDPVGMPNRQHHVREDAFIDTDGILRQVTTDTPIS